MHLDDFDSVHLCTFLRKHCLGCKILNDKGCSVCFYLPSSSHKVRSGQTVSSECGLNEWLCHSLAHSFRDHNSRRGKRSSFQEVLKFHLTLWGPVVWTTLCERVLKITENSPFICSILIEQMLESMDGVSSIVSGGLPFFTMKFT